MLESLSNKRPEGLDDQSLIRAWQSMLRARLVDEKAITLYKQNKAHFQIGCAGHEAVQVAAANAMKPGHDWAYPYYRDMAFCSAWGVTNRELFLNILNKADDPSSGGRQMPNHYGHQGLNIVSQSSPTGTQYLQAVGAGRAQHFFKTGGVVYVSSGEGTTAQGAYHEALNWAARKKLPVIFLVQDNQFAISVHISQQIAGESVADISSGYECLEVRKINGLDYFESYNTFSDLVKRARSGAGPAVVVADVVRLQSHSISDNQAKYRSLEEIESDKEKDPILHFAAHLLEQKVCSEDELENMRKGIKLEVDEDAEWAEAQASPDPSTALKFVYNENPVAEFKEKPATGEDIFLVDSLNHALDEEMSRDENMIIYGQDVAYGKGGVFSVTSGLTDKYGEKRVFNAPLAEASICGTAIGMATVGMKPVVEIQFGDYIWTGMMQLRNELAMMHYRSNGNFSCNAVIRVAVGGYIHGALYHSQNIEATFAHYPGLKVIYPSNATDGKGLLKAAIRDNNPIIFLEHKGLYRQTYAKGPEGDSEHLIPIGKAKVIRTGEDATIVTWGALVQKSILAAKELEEDGVSVEVIDIRTIRPLDIETILSSVKKTGRVLIAHEDTAFMGFGAEIAAQIASDGFEYLDAPVARLAGAESPVPHASCLEKVVLPQTEGVIEALSRLLSY